MIKRILQNYKLETILGEYHLGLLYASTIFERFSIQGPIKDPKNHNLHQRVTALHEMFHALQDINTGYGAFTAFYLDALTSMIRVVSRLISSKKNTLLIPLHFSLDMLDEKEKEIARTILDFQQLLRIDSQFIRKRNTNGVGTLEILEGTAAFFSELAQDYSRIAYLEGDMNSSSGIEFERICSCVADRPSPYNEFITDYYNWTKHLPKDVTDQEKCNFLFILHDISLDIPTPETIAERLRNKVNTIDDFIPSKRYQKVMKFITNRRGDLPSFPNHMITPLVTMLIKNEDNTIHLAEKPNWERLSEANKIFGSSKMPGNNSKAYLQYLDHLYDSHQLNWPQKKENMNEWVRILSKVEPQSSFQLFNDWRSKCMTRCSSEVFMNFASILNHIYRFPLPLVYSTGNSIRVYSSSKEFNKSAIDFLRHVSNNFFLTSLTEQIIRSQSLKCPFAGTPWTKEFGCPESAACKQVLDLKNEKYSRCDFGRYFLHNFGLQPDQVLCSGDSK